VSVFDVSDPANPTEMSTIDTPGSAVGIALSGNYAFVADDTGGLRVLDISNPAAPPEVGSETTSANVTDVAVQDNYAYISGEVALLILDVATPSTPVVVGSYDLTGNSMAVAVQGNHAYLVHDIHLLSFDVSDKTTPVYLDGGLVDGGNNVALSGDHAFVPGQSGMRIFDISDPAQVTHVGTASGLHGFDVSLEGNLAYVAYGLGGYDVRDVTDVASPTVVFDGDNGWKESKAVAFAGDYAYVASTEGLLKIVDVSDVGNVAEVGNMEFTPFHLPLNVTAVASNGNYAYVAQAAVGLAGVDMEIIDVTDPANPVHAGTFNDPNNTVQINSMQVVGNYLYTAKGSYGLRVYDLAAPLAPAPLGNFFTNGPANGFVVDGNTTYVLDGSPVLGLRVVDTSNPSAMTEIASFLTPGVAAAIALDAASGRLLIADDGNGVIILDVNDPSDPTELSTLSTITHPSDVAVSGEYAYVTDAAGVHIVDVSNPAAPFVMGLFEKTSGGELRVMTREDGVFVLEELAGLYSLFNGSTASGVSDVRTAPHAVLQQNTPNPFNPLTVIRFSVRDTGPVRLNVYDVSGRLVRTLVNGVRVSQAAPYSVSWDGRDDNDVHVASGVYFYKLVTNGSTHTKKMVLVK